MYRKHNNGTGCYRISYRWGLYTNGQYQGLSRHWYLIHLMLGNVLLIEHKNYFKWKKT